MTSRSKYRGNDIYRDKTENIWRYVDDNTPVPENHLIKPCGNCGAARTPEGHDGCLGTLIGVMNACCGHGNEECSYVQFLDGETVHGKEAKIILDILKRNSR